MLKPGNLPENVYKRSVSKELKFRKSECVKGAAFGDECAFFAFPDSGCVTSCVTFCGLGQGICRMGIHAAVNNIITQAEPFGVQLALTVPIKTRERMLKELAVETEETCKECEVEVTKFDIKLSEAVVTPVLTVQAIGKPIARKTVTKKVRDMDLILTKWAGIGGTVMLATEKEADLNQRFPNDYIEGAKQMTKDLSVIPEAATAGKSDIEETGGFLRMFPVGEGGVFATLWKLAEQFGVGLQIDLKSIPIRQETVEICNYYDINPYELQATGSMLICTDRAEDVVALLEQEKIKATIIGKTTSGNDRLVINGEEKRFLTPAGIDEIYKLKMEGLRK